jgi:signal transduction histidine kinase
MITLTRIRQFFIAPVFEDEDKTRAAGLVNGVLLVSLAGAVLLLVVGITGGLKESRAVGILVSSIMIAVLMVLKVLLHRGYTRLAGMLLSLTIWTGFTIPMFVFDGIRDVTLTGYFAVIAMTSLVLGGHPLLVITLLSSITAVAAFYAEKSGIIVTTLGKPSSPADLIVVLLTLNTTALLSGITVRRMMAGYERARRNEKALARQAQELARSNEELEQFAYAASHDLQEPLRMVSSYLRLLERRYKGQLDTDADEFIAFAVDGATRMQTLINDLLTYSRIGTRGKPFAPTDSAGVLNQALTNLQVAIEESGATVTHDEMPTVLADDMQLAQLLQNLAGNAVKFRKPDTPPQIHVGVERSSGDWVFSVRDNGIGIDPQHFERIFLIFQRLHSREEYEGTGIGLAVCRKIVERHGGRIWVESEPGEGSTFYFTIPDRGPQRWPAGTSAQ